MQDRNNDKGFTLIELMIVITIIGILAAVAVPVYQDYTVRTRVAECTSLFGPIKTATTLYVSDNGTLPSALASLSGISSDPNEHSGEYVDNIDVGAGGVVTCTLGTGPGLGGPVANGGAGGGTLILNPDQTGNRITWSVDSASTVPAEFRPNL